MRLKINKIDIIIFIITIIIIITTLFSANYIKKISAGEILYVNINIDGETKFTYKLNEDKTITLKKEDYPTLLGEMVIEIKDKKVRVSKEKSPYNYCSKQGWVEDVATPIICLPNAVIVTISGNIETENDVVLPS